MILKREFSATESLTEDNWLSCCASRYDNPGCTGIDEFQADMSRFKYVRKLLTQHARGGELKERLILNHIILLTNVLGAETSVRVLFLKMRDHLPSLMPFLVLLNILPADDVVRAIGHAGEDIRVDEITLDQTVISALRRNYR